MQLSLLNLDGTEDHFAFDENIAEDGAETTTVITAIHEGQVSSDDSPFESGRTSREFQIASISGVPEFKTMSERQCVGRGWARVCVNVPVIYRRSSSYKAYARISTGRVTNDQIWDSVRQCTVSAAVTAGIAGILAASASGGAGITAAKPAFYAALVACLQARGGEFINIATDLRLDLFTKKETGDWRRSS